MGGSGNEASGGRDLGMRQVVGGTGNEVVVGGVSFLTTARIFAVYTKLFLFWFPWRRTWE